FPKDAAMRYRWSLALVPRKNKKAAELLDECESALSGWLLENLADATEPQDIWSNRIHLGEDLLVFDYSLGIFAGSHLPDKPFIWFLLQQLYLDAMDRRVRELSKKTSGKLNNLFKVTPAHLLKHNELTTLCAEVSSIRLCLDAVEEPVCFPRR